MSIKSEKENYNNVYCRFRPMTKEESEFSSEQISPLTSSTILNINTILIIFFHQILPNKIYMKNVPKIM